MLRPAAFIVLAAVAATVWPGQARAAEPLPPEACMKPIPPGSPDPVVRDVHFHVTNGSPLISITLCIASSHANVLQGAAANVGVFSHDGVLINYAGQSYTNVAPLANPPADGPKLVLMYGVAIQVDPKYGQEFAPNTVVALTTVSCTKEPPACDPAPARTQTFLLPVQIDHDLPGGSNKEAK
jgi:hypothetical protein